MRASLSMLQKDINKHKMTRGIITDNSESLHAKANDLLTTITLIFGPQQLATTPLTRFDRLQSPPYQPASANRQPTTHGQSVGSWTPLQGGPIIMDQKSVLAFCTSVLITKSCWLPFGSNCTGENSNNTKTHRTSYNTVAE
jgi:hypothetical protein